MTTRRLNSHASRQVIINADDFGRSAGINLGVIAAYQNGIVTSASLMVRWPDAADAAAMAREHPGLSLGLHVDLGEWHWENDEWICTYEVVPPHDQHAVAGEIQAQLERFRELVGLDPTHLDSHQNVHRREPARSTLIAWSRRLGIPLREVNSPARYRGGFFGQSRKGEPVPDHIRVDSLIRLLESLSSGLTELGCHPGAVVDIDSVYNLARVRELAALCDPAVRRTLALANVSLRSFAGLQPEPAATNGFWNRRESSP